MHLSFLKKKKKKRNGIVAMALPNSIPLFTIPKGFFYPPISAMPLPQLPKIYTLYFGNAIAANYFFFLPFSAMALLQLLIFFSHHLVFLARTHTSSTHPGRRNCGNTIAENKKFLSPTFYLSLQLLLNFGNGIAVIPSLSSDC